MTPRGGKVALFVDFENIRYSCLNQYHQEPDPAWLMQKARRYGLVKLAYAYADFTQHPDYFKGKCEAAGIRRVDVPVRQLTDQDGRVRVKSSADIQMVMDVFETVLENDDIETYVLATGDKDFTRISASLVNRFGRNVIIVGVPGAVSRNLVDSATAEDMLDVSEAPLGEGDARYVRWLDWMDHHWTNPRFMPAVRYIAGPAKPLGSLVSEDQARAVMSRLVKQEIVLQLQVLLDDGSETRIIRLNRDHPFVQSVLVERQAYLAAHSERQDSEEQFVPALSGAAL